MRKTIHSASTEQMVFCLLRCCPKPRLTQSFRLRPCDSLNRLWRNIELESQFNISKIGCISDRHADLIIAVGTRPN